MDAVMLILNSLMLKLHFLFQRVVFLKQLSSGLLLVTGKDGFCSSLNTVITSVLHMAVEPIINKITRKMLSIF